MYNENLVLLGLIVMVCNVIVTMWMLICLARLSKLNVVPKNLLERYPIVTLGLFAAMIGLLIVAATDTRLRNSIDQVRKSPASQAVEESRAIAGAAAVQPGSAR